MSKSTLTTQAQVDTAVAATRRVQATLLTSAYTFGLADEGQLVQQNAASAVTFTVPANATTAFPIGAWIEVANWNTGSTAIQGATGVALVHRGVFRSGATNSITLSSQRQVVRLLKTATDTWVVYELTADDTGWVTLTPAAGYTATNLAVRRIGDQVYLRGNVTRTAGNFGTSTYETITTLPDPKFRAGTYTRAQTPLFASATATANVVLVADPATNDLTIGGNGTSNTAYLGAVSYLAT